MLMGLMSGEAAEHEAMELAAAAAGAAGADPGLVQEAEEEGETVPPVAEVDASKAPPPAAAMLDAAAIQKMIADAIAAAMGAKPDAAPPAPSVDAAKKDRDAEALIAAARDASTRAFNDAAALTEGVRKDGHAGIIGADSAAAQALSIIDAHLPALKVDAEAALKSGNIASFLRFYDASEAKRRERLLDEQGAHIVGAFRADATGPDAAPAPFILPSAHVR